MWIYHLKLNGQLVVPVLSLVCDKSSLWLHVNESSLQQKQLGMLNDYRIFDYRIRSRFRLSQLRFSKYSVSTWLG